jgi:coenzyme PQQ precursor peptide PqqA
MDRTTKQGDGQASSLSNLQITTQHLDADYQLLKDDLTRGETGLLRVFSLIPKTAGKPSFAARVDDGSPGKRRPPELDPKMLSRCRLAHLPAWSYHIYAATVPRTWSSLMTWKTPKIVEVPVGMEINMYACAARK